MWYSFNFGPVHFISVDTETDFPNAAERNTGDSDDPRLRAGHFAANGEYLKWLETDLKKASEARAAGHGPRWIVAGGHRPYGDIVKEHVPLFNKYGLDLYVAGHGHSYARGRPVNGTTYIMVGGAGCDEMKFVSSAIESSTCVPSGSPRTCEEGYAVPPHAEAYRTARIASGVLRADSEALHWELIDSVSGKVLDHVTINAHEQRRIVV